MALSDLYPGIRPGTPYAGRWRSFLDDLRLQGISVDPSQSGGYNPRNVRGTTMPSLHASDRAYDVNWRANPEGSRQDEADIARQHLERDMGGSTAPITQLHPMLARETAARHGLRWGGDFRTRSPDPMHFEVAGPAPGGMPGRSLIAHAGMTPPATQPPTPSGGPAMILPWMMSSALAPVQRAPAAPMGVPAAGGVGGPLDWMLPPEQRGPRGAVPPIPGGVGSALDWMLPPEQRGQSARAPTAFAPPPEQPEQPPALAQTPPVDRGTIEAPLPITPMDPDAVVNAATAAHGQNNPPRPGFFEGLHNWVASPMFQSAIALATQRDPAAAMAQAATTHRQQSEYQRQQQQRTVMDRIWGEAFPNGQPNMSHPLLANQSPQVAAMIAGMGPEMALPLLAKSAMERRQLELKEIGGEGVVFNPTTGQIMQVPGVGGGNAPSGYRWNADRTQLEPIPGGPGEQIAGEIAGRLALMQTARGHYQQARNYFERQLSLGEAGRHALGGAVLAPQLNQARRTIRLAIEGALRAATGANAPEPEVDRYTEFFTPHATDPPEVRKQKLDMLEQFMTNAEANATRGRGGPQQGAPASDGFSIRRLQ